MGGREAMRIGRGATSGGGGEPHEIGREDTEGGEVSTYMGGKG